MEKKPQNPRGEILMSNLATVPSADENLSTTVDRMALLRKQFKKNPLEVSYGMRFADQFKRVIHTASTKKFDEIELLHITDVQYGAVSCSEKRMLEYRDW